MPQIPNIAEPITDQRTGRVSTPWYQFLASLSTSGGGGGIAPGNADYIVTDADPDLPNARVATDSDTVDIDLTVPGIIRWHAAGGEAWVPLALGVEPLAFVSDGAGSPILVGYTP
jgi:hypothetical protein